MHTIDIQVRLPGDEAHVTTFFDGKPLAEWKGSPDRLCVYEHWQLPDRSRIGLGAWCRLEAGTVNFLSAKVRLLDKGELPDGDGE